MGPLLEDLRRLPASKDAVDSPPQSAEGKASASASVSGGGVKAQKLSAEAPSFVSGGGISAPRLSAEAPCFVSGSGAQPPELCPEASSFVPAAMKSSKASMAAELDAMREFLRDVERVYEAGL